jgi:DNA-binding XRE family transcriptional regulator
MKKPSKYLGRRTPGEKLWLARRAAGKTSYEAAALAGVGRNAYREAERDENPAPAPLKTGLKPVSRPSLALLLALARRRSGLGLDRTAKVLSISRMTVLAAERRGDPALVRFWEKRGFRFPNGSA